MKCKKFQKQVLELLRDILDELTPDEDDTDDEGETPALDVYKTSGNSLIIDMRNDSIENLLAIFANLSRDASMSPPGIDVKSPTYKHQVKFAEAALALSVASERLNAKSKVVDIDIERDKRDRECCDEDEI